jgi:hypothetical protein
MVLASIREQSTFKTSRSVMTLPTLLKSFRRDPAARPAGRNVLEPSASAPFGQTTSSERDATDTQTRSSRTFLDPSRGQGLHCTSHTTSFEMPLQWRALLAQAGLGDLTFPTGVPLCPAWRDFLANLAKRQQTDELARVNHQRIHH